MLQFSLFVFASLLVSYRPVHGQSCPEIPETGIDFGAAVGPFPEDVPSGCSAFEILVGKSTFPIDKLSHHLSTHPHALINAPARGTSEPNFEPAGKFGVIVGDPVVSNVSARLPDVRGYPVQYPASFNVITGGIQGRRDVFNRLTRQSALCPNQKFALVGYSQGASVMHSAADEIPTSLYPRILALAMFGDPELRTSLGDRFPAALEAKLLESCAIRDPVSFAFMLFCTDAVSRLAVVRAIVLISI